MNRIFNRKRWGQFLILACIILPLIYGGPLVDQQTVFHFSDYSPVVRDVWWMILGSLPLLAGLVFAWKAYWRFVAPVDNRSAMHFLHRIIMLGAVVIPTVCAVSWASREMYTGLIDTVKLSYLMEVYVFYGFAQLGMLVGAWVAWKFAHLIDGLFDDGPKATSTFDPMLRMTEQRSRLAHPAAEVPVAELTERDDDAVVSQLRRRRGGGMAGCG